jgi:hypothetical protein
MVFSPRPILISPESGYFNLLIHIISRRKWSPVSAFSASFVENNFGDFRRLGIAFYL